VNDTDTVPTGQSPRPALGGRCATGKTMPGGKVAALSEGESRDVKRMDDFQVIAERRRVMAALAALTDQYRELNQELQRRESLRWMLAR